jgi:hypothetical protein
VVLVLASRLLGRYSTAWTGLCLFALVILEIGLTVCPGQPGPRSSYFTLPAIGGITGRCHCTQLFSIDMGVLWNIFCPSCLGTVNLPILAFLVVWDDRSASLYPAITWDEGSYEVLAWTGLKSWSSRSQLLK